MTLIKLTKTARVGLNGEPIFKASAGPYRFATFSEDFIELGGRLEKVEMIFWCSRDGEANCPIDADKYDIQEVARNTQTVPTSVFVKGEVAR